MAKKNEYPKLPKAFKRKWLEALRSGKYKQGAGYLHTINDDGQDTYCCLGVAGAVCGISTEKMRGVKLFNPNKLGLHLSRRQCDRIPKALRGGLNDNPLVHELIIMNDEGKTFKHIANWIEKNL